MAEGNWLSLVIEQVSPRIGELFSSTLCKKVEPLIQRVLKSSPFGETSGGSGHSLFRFDSVSFGSVFPKCEEMETHRTRGKKAKAITVDFLFTYAGDCDIQISLLGASSGVRDLQIQGRARIVLKPMMSSLPFTGGFQFCFLEIPRISFDFDGLAGSLADLPGVKSLIMKNLRKEMAEQCVYPNKIIIPLSQSADAMIVHCLDPRGVLVVHLLGGSNLPSKGGMRKMFGQADPDGYVRINFGAAEATTTVVKNTTEPTWDEWFEFPVETLLGHSVAFDVFDEDTFSKDEFLGRARIPIWGIVDEGLSMEVSVPLEAVPEEVADAEGGGGDVQGEISAQLFYRYLTDVPSEEDRLFDGQSLVYATVFIYSCNNLVIFADGSPCDGLPSSQVTVQLGSQPMKQTVVLESQEHPSFQEGFHFTLGEGWQDEVLSVMVEDTASGQPFGDVTWPLSELASQEDASGGETPKRVVGFHRKCISLSADNPQVTVTMSAVLRFVTSTPPQEDEEE